MSLNVIVYNKYTVKQINTKNGRGKNVIAFKSSPLKAENGSKKAELRDVQRLIGKSINRSSIN